MSYFTTSELGVLAESANARQAQRVEDAIPHVLKYVLTRMNKGAITDALKKVCSEHTEPKDLRIRLCAFPWHEPLGLTTRKECIRQIVNTPQFRGRLANRLGLGYFVVHTVFREADLAVLSASFFPKGNKGIRRSKCLFKNTGTKLHDHLPERVPNTNFIVCTCCGAYSTDKEFEEQLDNERHRRHIESPDPLHISFSPISQEHDECSGCGEDIEIGANGYCVPCWRDTFGVDDETQE